MTPLHHKHSGVPTMPEALRWVLPGVIFWWAAGRFMGWW